MRGKMACGLLSIDILLYLYRAVRISREKDYEPSLVTPRQAVRYIYIVDVEFQTLYRNDGALSPSSRSLSFCSSVSFGAGESPHIRSRRAFSNRHHIVMNVVRINAML